jgi:hypothetical protein
MTLPVREKPQISDNWYETEGVVIIATTLSQLQSKECLPVLLLTCYPPSTQNQDLDEH